MFFSEHFNIPFALHSPMFKSIFFPLSPLCFKICLLLFLELLKFCAQFILDLFKHLLLYFTVESPFNFVKHGTIIHNFIYSLFHYFTLLVLCQFFIFNTCSFFSQFGYLFLSLNYVLVDVLFYLLSSLLQTVSVLLTKLLCFLHQ